MKHRYIYILSILILLTGIIPAHAAPLAAAPGNDDFASATTIPSIPYESLVNVTDATQDVTDPNESTITSCDGHSLNKGNKTVWYKYTPPVTGNVYMDALGSDYDTYIAVFTGTEGNLTLIACDDDNNDGFQSELTFNGISGTTYYIEVAEYNGEGGSAGEPSSGTDLQFHVTTFIDVRGNHEYWKYIESIYAAGLTAGCSTSPLSFCIYCNSNIPGN